MSAKADIFKPGRLTIVKDGCAGSSAKGVRAANIWKHHKAEHTTFSTNTFMSNAAHTIAYRDGREYIHQCLSSMTTLGNYERQYLGPGCVFSLTEFLNECKNCEVGPTKVSIHPNIAIVSEKDIEYERGTVDFEGNQAKGRDVVNLKIGSTLHGVGAARARRVLRRSDCKLARDFPELADYITNTNHSILHRLEAGESGLGEIAQGYQLSLFSEFYPKCTSRNCTVAAFLDDSMLPPSVLGPIVVNFRTFPIRVNSNKYIEKSTGKILTWDDMQHMDRSEIEIIKGDSGGCYPDQREISWEEISANAGKEIVELTSLTRLQRRCYSFSKVNMVEAFKFNNANTPMYLSINFMNYVDPMVEGKDTVEEVLTPKVIEWLKTNILQPEFLKLIKTIDFHGLFIGTWKTVDDSVYLTATDLLSL